MWALLAEWSDADTINAMLGGGGLAAVVTAVGILLVRYTRQRGANRAAESEQKEKANAREFSDQEKSEARTFDEMRIVTAELVARVKDMGRELAAANRRTDAVREEVEKRAEALNLRIIGCETQRAAQGIMLATLQEENRWMKKLLRSKGLLSDDDEERLHTPAGIPIPTKSPPREDVS